MSNFGSYVKAIRKASTHLTEEPFLRVQSFFLEMKMFTGRALAVHFQYYGW